MVRLQRVMADAGVGARRVCERLIEQGHVTVNGECPTRLPVFVDPHRDRIVVDGRVVARPERRVYLMVNKPAGTLVSAADEPGMDRRTVGDLIDHPSAPRLFSVGRLDLETTGLVLMTNDGDLANRLTHPKYEVSKTYQIAVKGNVDDAAAEAIKFKLRVVGQRAAAEEGKPAPRGEAQVEVVRRESDRTLIEVTLSEARNRELREVLRVLGLPVKKMTRVAIGPLRLRGLALGQWRELTRDEVQDIRRASTSAGRKTPRVGVGRVRRPVKQEVRARKPPRRGARPQGNRQGPAKPAAGGRGRSRATKGSRS